MVEKKEQTPKKRVRARKKDPAKDFELLAEKLKGKESVRYSMSGSFKANYMIEHDTFGSGVVISTSYKKIEVVFADKLRLLTCDRFIMK